MNGIVSAVEHFSKELDVNLKESTVRTWKAKYLAEVRLRKKADDGTPLSVTSLPQKKRGRPLMLGESLDTEVKHYLTAVRKGGGVITTAITMASATAIVYVELIETSIVRMEVQSQSQPIGQNPFFIE